MSRFSYSYYRSMLTTALNQGYIISSFHDYNETHNKTVILRHDIDYTLNGVLELATIEHELKTTATYLFRIHAHEYNLFSPYVIALIRELKKMGHEIGLHYEAPAYSRALGDDVRDVFLREVTVFETILQQKVNTVAEHKDFGHAIQKTDCLFDFYSVKDFDIKYHAMAEEYCKKMKYLSDSNAYWREGDLLAHLNQYDRYQILVHPDWWHESDLLLKGPYYHRFINHNILEAV